MLHVHIADDSHTHHIFSQPRRQAQAAPCVLIGSHIGPEVTCVAVSVCLKQIAHSLGSNTDLLLLLSLMEPGHMPGCPFLQVSQEWQLSSAPQDTKPSHTLFPKEAMSQCTRGFLAICPVKSLRCRTYTVGKCSVVLLPSENVLLKARL